MEKSHETVLLRPAGWTGRAVMMDIIDRVATELKITWESCVDNLYTRTLMILTP